MLHGPPPEFSLARPREAPVENQYDSYEAFLARKVKTGGGESFLERVNKGIDRGARLRYL